jgi:hypothetical protein
VQTPINCWLPDLSRSRDRYHVRQHRTAASSNRWAGHLAGCGGVLATTLLGLLPGSCAARGVEAGGAATLNTDVTGCLCCSLPRLEAAAEPPSLGSGGRGRSAVLVPPLAL